MRPGADREVGPPGNTFGEIGSNDTISAGPGNDTIWTIGSGESITGGATSGHTDLIGLIGNNSSISGEGGNDTVYASGNNDTVAGGSGNALIEWSGSNHTFLDNTAVYNDTIVGFDQPAGDTIKLSTTGRTVASSTVNSGQDTLITLSDSSTILLKGVNNVTSSFFS